MGEAMVTAPVPLMTFAKSGTKVERVLLLLMISVPLFVTALANDPMTSVLPVAVAASFKVRVAPRPMVVAPVYAVAAAPAVFARVRLVAVLPFPTVRASVPVEPSRMMPS